MSVTIRVIFGRHGTSCANVMKETSSISLINLRRRYYSDPELSHSGREQVETLQPLFLKKLKGEDPIVCASGLLRAQQTAYGLTHADTIYIVPHICEIGIGDDNVPLSKAKQEKILKDTSQEELIPRRNFDYYDSNNKTSFSRFKKWFGHNWSSLSKGDSSRLFVFISHGLFIRKFIKNLPERIVLPETKNCQCYELSFTIDKNTVTDVHYVGEFKYADLPGINTELDCKMDTCRKPSCLHWTATRAIKQRSVVLTRKKKRTESL